MLNRHLIATTKAKANDKNIVLWDCYRISILFDRLFRIERSENGVFRDDATQSVWYRDMPPVKYTITVRADFALIQTKTCTLVIKHNRKDCRICLDNNTEQEISNTGNLLGTTRTLDCCNGNSIIPFSWLKMPEDTNDKLQLENGVCSKSGVAVLDDTLSLSLALNGEVEPKVGDGSDEYVFAYGHDYQEAVKALYAITGFPPRIPRYALGNWWSRYHDYSRKEYLQLLQKFETHDVPLSVAILDMDWHYSKTVDEDFKITQTGKNTDFYGGNSGWTGYTWNKRLFPDYKAFLRELKAKNVKVTLNLHPAEGVRWFEDSYPKLADALKKDKESGAVIAFDIANSDYINAYFKILHKPYENDGVDFWWIDWQQGTTSAIDGLDPLWSLNHYHYLDHAINHTQPLILSRYSGVGAHRYPVGFSGDTLISWETLDFLPYFTATASNIGYTWWSPDIGGHMFGNVSGELYVRHVQFGVFSPINRLHSSDAPTTTKEPWAYGNGCGKIAMEWLRFRHKLIPFLYSCAYQTHKNGQALIKPLYYEWDTPIAYDLKNEYIFGEKLLIAPISTPIQNAFAKTKVWLSQGVWTDVFTGDEYIVENEKTFYAQRDLESIPVFAKDGTILPLSADKGNGAFNPVDLEVLIFNGNGEFTLYEDGNETETKGALFTFFKTTLTKNRVDCTQTVLITSTGADGVAPKNRQIRLLFKNIPDGETQVFINGKSVEINETFFENVAVELPFIKGNEYQIEVNFKERTHIEKLLERAKRVLVCAEGDNEGKAICYNKLLESTSVYDYKRLVHLCPIDSEIKERLLETL